MSDIVQGLITFNGRGRGDQGLALLQQILQLFPQIPSRFDHHLMVRDVEIILPDHEVVVEPGGDLREQLQDLLEKRQALITAPATAERDKALNDIRHELRELGRR